MLVNRILPVISLLALCPFLIAATHIPRPASACDGCCGNGPAPEICKRIRCPCQFFTRAPPHPGWGETETATATAPATATATSEPSEDICRECCKVNFETFKCASIECLWCPPDTLGGGTGRLLKRRT
ncbi:hypothetical protein BDZ88DRAFT_406992 [Geranomyces variabilis]|nr:hypothetical protein BDZ88DRAFT_406992 [Geranomyces variabilis]